MTDEGERPMSQRMITAYTVRRVHWEYNDEYYDRHSETHPERVFLDRDKADADCRECEAAARRAHPDWNLYTMGGWEFERQTTLTHRQVIDRLTDAGMEGVPQNPEVLFSWVHERAETGTPEEQALIWELMDRCRFYEVVPVEIELEE